MTGENKLDANIILIAQEIRRLADMRFTGKSSVDISFRDGGIGQISVMTSRNLIKNSTSKKS